MFQNIADYLTNTNKNKCIHRCQYCNVIGLVKKIQNIQHCNCTNRQSCYMCENNKFKGLYKECENCWGSGKKSEPLVNED